MKSTAAADPAPARPSFTVFAVAEVRGQIGPCGCTSDPLGDLARTAQLVTAARAAGPVVFVDAGSLLYAHAPTPPQLAAQEELKADLLAETYQKTLLADAVGLGPADLPNGAAGLAHLRLPRVVSNPPASSGLPAEPKLLEVGGAKVGVFGVVAPGAIPGLATTDPVAAGKQAVASLRGKGAQAVIGLLQTTSRKEAVQLMRDIGGIDFAVGGLGLLAPEPERIEIAPQKVGDGWLVVPANRGQTVARFEVTLRGAGPFADAVGPAAAAAKLAVLDRDIAALDADLKAFADDASADPKFVAQKKKERGELAADRARLKVHPLLVPAQGNYFTVAQVRIAKALACDTGVQDAVSTFFRRTGEINVKAAASVAVTPPAPGKAGYSGNASCTDCHEDAAKFWDKTVHAQAWKTLVDRGQQFDLDCIGCHVTGWEKPGGSTLGHNENLRAVGCEACHGPGSIHVAGGGLEKPLAITLRPPEDLCATQCHTKEHSDTFQRQAYLRDIIGPGHGEKASKVYSDGPTGAQLRKAALDKAGRELGAGCTR